ncbi:MAG TPA: alpha/beta hydrolase [Candidatus Stackebrandtia faecavium]|nr:alpha/beta hydrolase [Candidatus Stackebrandtia faecavium]
MATRKRWLVAAAAATVAVAATGVTVTATAAETESSIDWKPCTGEDVEGVDCATIEVPLQYAEPDGPTIEIGLAKRSATGDKQGTVLMDPGGPGGSGVDTVKSGKVLTDKVAESYDIVGFDPRGINTSTQVQCEADSIPNTQPPASEEEFAAMKKAHKAFSDSCRESTGELHDHLDNLHTVEDIEQIRQALGEGELNFLGYSYGTLMGQQYAEAYPQNVRSLVLDGNMDHSITSTYEFMATETKAVEDNFTAFAQWCEGDDSCALAGEDVLDIYGELRELARDGKLADPATGVKINFYDLAAMAFDSSFPDRWEELGSNLAALDSDEGELSDGATTADIGVAELENAPVTSIFCQDWDLPIESYDQFKSYEKKLAEDYPNVQWTPYNSMLLDCVGYDTVTTNPQRPLDIEGDPSMLLIGNTHDFATVYPWSESVQEQTGASLLTYDGYGHTIYGGASDCINSAVEDYILTLKEPKEGATCEAPGDTVDQEPFVVKPQPY